MPETEKYNNTLVSFVLVLCPIRWVVPLFFRLALLQRAMISVLCVSSSTVYKRIEGLDLWDASRNAYNYTGLNPVVAHPPCQQWSRLRTFARVCQVEKDLSIFCLEKVQVNGGVFEHPHGSSFFKFAGVRPNLCIEQSWFGFPARKRTWLLFEGCKPLSFPLSFDAPIRKVDQLGRVQRSAMTLKMANWLVESVKQIDSH